jgi:hypothetical protein
MAKKFLLIVAGIITVMAALVFLPGLAAQQGELAIEYYRDNVVRSESGMYDTINRETLTIANDGSARYQTLDGEVDRRFFVSSEELKVLRELFLNTGFMQIPNTGFNEKAGLSNYTRYNLLVQNKEESQVLHWVNPEASNGAIPSIVLNAGSRLDAIIERNS